MSNLGSENRDFKLKGEIQKRKTQEMQRAIVADQVSRAQGQSPSTAAAKRITQTAAVVPEIPSVIRPITRSHARKSPIPAYQRATQVAPAVRTQLTRRQKLWITIGITGGLIVLVSLGTISMASSYTAVELTPTPWATPADVDSASLMAYLVKVGLPPMNFRQYDPKTNGWHAQDEHEFDLLQGENKADVIILTYSSHDTAQPDTFGLSRNAKLKNWRWMTLANVVVLVSPDTERGFGSAIFGHIAQLIMAPNHPLWPTATFVPTVTPPGTVVS